MILKILAYGIVILLSVTIVSALLAAFLAESLVILTLLLILTATFVLIWAFHRQAFL